MRRISTATRVVNKFGVGKDGFTNGNPVGGIAATDLEDAWFDHVQEEVATFVEAAGLTLDPNNRSQMLAALPKLATGRYLGTRVFTSNGTYTPTTGTTSVIVELVGGGGAGGNTSITGVGQTSVAGGGGAGGYARSRLTSGFSGVSMTVGAGGLALSTVNGGATSFGALLSATGGTGGSNAPAQTPPVLSIQGHGGGGSSGNLANARGGDGMPGIAAQNTSTVSGAGGSSYFGGGGIGQPTGAGPGQTATSPGAAGGGAFAGPSVGATQVGGDGAAGIILVHEFA